MGQYSVGGVDLFFKVEGLDSVLFKLWVCCSGWLGGEDVAQ